MSTFDPHKHPRDRGGKFTEVAREEQDVPDLGEEAGQVTYKPLPERLRSLIENSKDDLEDLDLSGYDLSGVDFSSHLMPFRREIRRVKMTGYNLKGANLQDAWITDSDLEGADLGETKLDYATLEDTSLKNVDEEKDAAGLSLMKLGEEGAHGSWLNIKAN